MARLPPNRRRPVLLTAIGVLVLIALLVGWRVWQVRGDLLQARDYAEALRSAGDDRDLTDARVALTALREHAGDASDGTGGPSWWLLEQLPVVGDDAGAVAVMSQSLSALADAAAPLLDIAEDLDAGRVEISDGRVPLDTVRSYQEPMARAASVASEALSRVQALDGSYVGPLVEARRQAVEEIGQAVPLLRDAADTVELLPGLLGADGPRRYLLVQQNNAEIRSTAGFPGSTFLLRADAGRVEVAKPVATRKFPHLRKPVLRLTQGERRLFGERVGTWFVDANKIPDFRRAADLWAAHWRKRFGQNLDGVLSLDPVTLSYLMRATGPVTVAGTKLDTGNVVSELLSTTYARYRDPDAQDAFFREVGRRVFDAVESPRDPAELIRGLRRGVQESRVQFVSFRAREDAVLGRTAIAGPALSDDVPGVYISDTTGRYGSKMSYYLRYGADASSGCAAGEPVYRLGLDVRLATPSRPERLPSYVTGGDERVPMGAEDLEIVMLGVDGGTLSQVRLGGRQVAVRSARIAGRPAARVLFRLMPGERTRLTWRFSAPSAPSELMVTPSVVPGPHSIELPANVC